MRKLVLDSGHGGIDPGAEHEGLFEKDLCWDLCVRCRRLAESTAYKKQIQVHVIPHEPATLSPDPNRLINRVKDSNAWGPDLFLSIHWNSADTPTANGTECWYRNLDQASAGWADWITHHVAGSMGTHNRGIFPDSVNRHHSLGVLHRHNEDVRAALCEIGFITSEIDMVRFNHDRNAVAKAILDAAIGFALE